MLSECSAHFSEKGDPRNGAQYHTYVTLPNIDVQSAIEQLEEIVSHKGMQTGATQLDAGIAGVEILAKIPGVAGDFSMGALAQKATNQVHIMATLNRGQIASNDQMRDSMCSILSGFSTGTLSKTAAYAESKTTKPSEIIDIKATDLAKQVGKALKESDDTTQLGIKFNGRTYRIDGQVSRPSGSSLGFELLTASQSNRTLTITYVTKTYGIFGPKVGDGVQTPVSITCRTAPDQFARFAALKNEDYATLIGKVVGFVGKTRSKSIFNNPSKSRSLFADRSYGGTLLLDCRYEK